MTRLEVRIISSFALMNPHAERLSWQGEVEAEGISEETQLDWIFRHFNRVEVEDCERLEAMEYFLPSLSVGDIVCFKEADTEEPFRLRMVANVGFQTFMPGLGVITREGR